MTFGEAIECLKEGDIVTRDSWNGKNMFIYMVNSTSIDAGDLRNEALEHVGSKKKNPYEGVKINAHIDMYNAQGEIIVGWSASQTDMLADDWDLVY